MKEETTRMKEEIIRIIEDIEDEEILKKIYRFVLDAIKGKE
ncbi:hypothetical protein PBV87_07375 [Niameybacter massiliensis]|uniref:Uncharacterized protein n=1 Tax=Holtiella tumoricola TaxID=3018743 RepID=A0AA42J0F8_9FIRM|nr:hypothetical protein [Holtiella tumoricola]MDA3731299.1 hypothetical protein [Holtiella tumoricola]